MTTAVDLSAADFSLAALLPKDATVVVAKPPKHAQRSHKLCEKAREAKARKSLLTHVQMLERQVTTLKDCVSEQLLSCCRSLSVHLN